VHPEEQKSWFHCGRCGALFLAVPGESVNRTCPECGRHPVVFGDSPAGLQRSPTGPSALLAAAPAASGHKHGKRSHGNRMVIKIVIGWFVLLAGIIWFSAHIWGRDKTIGGQRRSKSEFQSGGKSNEDAAYARAALDPSWQALFQFLQARTPEERSQFVRKPLETVVRMARFYRSSPAVMIVPQNLTVERVGVLHLDGERALATSWKVADGRKIEAVFFQENQEWRLDWEHFVRYSEHPWALFLNGNGPDSAEFRVLARERLPLERRHTPEIGIVCHAPRLGFPAEADAPSPEFLVKRDSEAGRLLVAAFADLAAKRKPFGDTASLADPDDMIRLRIRVRREPVNNGFRFVLEKVVACHWISTDDPGVTPAAVEPKPQLRK
jgi:hypothetical protein